MGGAAECRPDHVLRQLQEAALQPPFVAKPLWADGREGAHGLAVLQDVKGVEQVVQGDAPASLSGTLLLSPFVQHGGCLFKVLLVHNAAMSAVRITAWLGNPRGASQSYACAIPQSCPDAEGDGSGGRSIVLDILQCSQL